MEKEGLIGYLIVPKIFKKEWQFKQDSICFDNINILWFFEDILSYTNPFDMKLMVKFQEFNYL